MLDALYVYYQRLAEEERVPTYGYSTEKISFALVLSRSGEPLSVVDLREHDGKKSRPRPMRVPVDPDKTRTSGIFAYPLWDKTSYALGVTAGAGKRLSDEHAAFKARQAEVFGAAQDDDLRAFFAFLKNWRPERLADLPGYRDDLLDTNVVFRIDGQREYLHDKPEAQSLWADALASDSEASGQCLVTGDTAPLASGHPRIREVNGAQSSGAYLISYNISAFESYGKRANENAPIAKSVAFAYAAALNHLLRRDTENHQRVQIGDASVVFWALGEGRKATQAEGLFAAMLAPPDDAHETDRLRSTLENIAQGRALANIDPDLDERTRFYVLGLAPNAARLSVRFWFNDTLGHFVRRFREHFNDLAIEPNRWNIAPAMWRLLYATAAQGKAENIPPQLAGELTRSILTGARYPRSLLANAIMRMRADGEVTDTRVALCKAVLAREARLRSRSTSRRQEVPVSLDRESINAGYRLGRLFAELENVQRQALGKNINATIRDRYYGAASATPASVFPLLLRNAQNHFAKLRKEGKGGLAHTMEAEIAAIVDGLNENLPRSLRIQDQGHFAIGYYHQSKARFAKREDAPKAEDQNIEQGEEA